MIDKYKRNLEIKGYAENTIKTYLYSVSSFMKHFDYNIDELKYSDMLNFIDYRMKNTTSINTQLSAIKNFILFLEDYADYKLSFNFNTLFMKNIKIKKRHIINDLDYEYFFDFIREKEIYIQLAFNLLNNTGIRISELVNLEKKDIFIKNDRVFLNIVDSKSKSDRIVPIFCSETSKQLLKHIKSFIENKIFYISIRGYQHYPIIFQEKTGIPISLHMIRHKFASRMIKEGVKLELLTKILGHENITTTMIYLDEIESEILKMGEAIK